MSLQALTDFVGRCDHTTERIHVAELRSLVEQLESYERALTWIANFRETNHYGRMQTRAKAALDAVSNPASRRDDG